MIKDVNSREKPVVVKRSLLATPLPKEQHLIYLGLAMASCYSFVGFGCVIATEEIWHPDSRAGAFFMFLTLPFWTAVVLSFRQLRLLRRHGIRAIDWLIIVISHLPFVYYIPEFARFWLGLSLGILMSLFAMPFSLLSGGMLIMCLLGQDPVPVREEAA